HAMAAAQMLGLPDNGYEIQMLYGMGDPVKDALVRLGQRVRVYTPYGQLLPGMAYLVRRLLENTANTSFLRASFAEHVPEEKLLMNPVDGQHRASLADPALPAAREPTNFRNEPLLDFSREAERQRMQEALALVRHKLGQTYPLIINGRPIPTKETIDSVNPSHQREIVGKC